MLICMIDRILLTITRKIKNNNSKVRFKFLYVKSAGVILQGKKKKEGVD